MHRGPKQSKEIERRLRAKETRETEKADDQVGGRQSAGRGRHIKCGARPSMCIIQVMSSIFASNIAGPIIFPEVQYAADLSVAWTIIGIELSNSVLFQFIFV